MGASNSTPETNNSATFSIFSQPPSDCPISILPDDQLLEILRRLPVRQILQAQCVCSRWDRLLRQPALWSKIDLSDVPDFSAKQAARLVERSRGKRGNYQLQKLNATGAWGLELSHLLPVLRRCKNLREITAYRGSTGRPMVDAACLEALLSIDQNDSLTSSSSVGISTIPETSQASQFLEMQPWSNRVASEGSGASVFRDLHMEIDLEVDWSPADEYGAMSSRLSPFQWDLVFSALAGKLPQLTVRACYFEVLAVQETWPRLLAALKGNDTLQELHLVCLQCDSPVLSNMLQSLAGALEGNTCLKRIQLRYAEFGVAESLAPLLRVLHSSSGLKCLEVIKCTYDPPLGVGFAELVSADSPLEELVLNPASKVSAISAALARNKKLHKVTLNGVMPEGIVALAEVLKKNDTLQSLDIRGSLISCSALFAMAEALEVNTSLTSLRMDNGEFDCGALQSEDFSEGTEAIIQAVEKRGGMDYLGLSIPNCFWRLSSSSPLFSLPKRFKRPNLYKLLNGSKPVNALYLSYSIDDWRAGDAAAWRVWFNLIKSPKILNASAEAMERRAEPPRKGVILYLQNDYGDIIETWETHSLGGNKHKVGAAHIVKDILLLLLFPIIQLWRTVDVVNHVDFSRYTCLDWIFMLPLAVFHAFGLVAGLVTLFVIGQLHSLTTQIFSFVRRITVASVTRLGLLSGFHYSRVNDEPHPLVCEVV